MLSCKAEQIPEVESLSSLKFKQIDLSAIRFPDRVQFLAMELDDTSIISGYIPPNVRVSSDLWDSIIDISRKPIILCGDFNCHHIDWNGYHCNPNGVQLQASLANSLVVLNDPTPTRVSPPGGSPAVIDLFICDPRLAACSSCTVLDDAYGSDHFPVLGQFGSMSPPAFYQNDPFPAGFYNLRKINWLDFNRALVSHPFFGSTEFNYDRFVECLVDCAHASAPWSVRRTLDKSCPWWDDDCSLAKLERRTALRNFRQSGRMDDFLIAKRAMAKAKRLFRLKKKSSFISFCSDFNRDTPIADLWKAFNRFKSGFEPPRPAPCSLNEPWRPVFLDSLCPDFVHQEFPAVYVENCTPDDSSVFTEKFSLHELNAVLLKPKDSAPGLDSVTYKMVAHSPISLKLDLLKYYNFCFSAIDFPDAWKRLVVVPILKPGRDPASAGSYRPIALTSVLKKIFECMIKNRLEWWAESKGTFPES